MASRKQCKPLLHGALGWRSTEQAYRVLRYLKAQSVALPTLLPARGGKVALRPGECVATVTQIAKGLGISISWALWLIKCLIACDALQLVRPSSRGRVSIFRVTEFGSSLVAN